MKLSVIASVLLLLINSPFITADDSNSPLKHGERVMFIKVDTPEGVSYKTVPYAVGIEAIKNGEAEEVNPFLSFLPTPSPASEPASEQAVPEQNNSTINNKTERVNSALSPSSSKNTSSQSQTSPSTSSAGTSSTGTSSTGISSTDTSSTDTSSTDTSSTDTSSAQDNTGSSTTKTDRFEQVNQNLVKPTESIDEVKELQSTNTESNSQTPTKVVVERDESGRAKTFSQFMAAMEAYKKAEVATIEPVKTATPTTTKSINAIPDYCRNTNIGVNLGGFNYYSSELLLNDLTKVAHKWGRAGSSAFKEVPFDLDENGYIKTLEPNEVAYSIITDMTWMADNDEKRYVLTYEGEGDIAFAFRKVIKILSQEPGKIIFQFTGKGRIGLALSNINPQNYVRNIHILPETSFLEGRSRQIASKKHTNLWDGVSIYRYLDPQHINNSIETVWSKRQTLDMFGVKHGISIEDIVSISNQTNTSPWILLPHLADDNYFRQAAKYVKKNLNPNLKVYLELSNETWNWGFKQARYFNNLGKETGTNYFYQYGKRADELFRIWSDEFGASQERIVNTIGTQFYNPWVTKMLFKEYPNLQKSADAVAVGYYIGGKLAGDEQSPYKTIDQLFDKLLSEEIEKAKEALLKHKDIADTYGVDLIAYEAGQHLVEHRKGLEYTNKLIEMNRHPRMYELYLKMYDVWKEVGGKELVWYSTISRYGKFGSWGLLESMAQDPLSSPKYKAFKEILRKEGC